MTVIRLKPHSTTFRVSTLKSQRGFKIGILAVVLAVSGANLVHADTYDSFTEPDELVQVAASEVGTIQEIHLKKGQQIRQGDLLVTLDLRVLEASRAVAKAKSENSARLTAAEVELEIKTKRLKKLTLLKNEGAGSSEEVDRAAADVHIAESQVAAVREEIGLSQLELARITAQIERNRVRSPIDGYVTQIDKKVGEYVSQNEPNVATVVNIDRLRARFHVTTALACQLRKGSRLALSMTAIATSSSSSSESESRREQWVVTEVDFVSPITDPDSGTVHIEVVFSNDNHTMRSGVRCRLHPNRPVDSIAQKPSPPTRRTQRQ